MAVETFPKKPPYLIITLDRHAGIFIMFSQMCIPPVLPGIAWHIGFAIENMSRFGLGTDKWNDDVKADGQSLCSVGNSPWPLVPHWNLFPYPGIPINPNILIPLLILMSTSTSFLSVGSVVAKNGPIAVMIPGVKVLGTNLACNDPFPMPTDIVLFGTSTVVLGFTLGDLVAALIRWAIEIAIAYATALLGKAVGALGKRIAGKLGTSMAKRFTGPLGTRVSSMLQRMGGLGPKPPPGLLKRAHLNALDSLGLPKVYHAPKPPGGVFGSLDRMFGADLVRPGQFQSVADTLIKAEGKIANGAFDKFVKDPLKEAAVDQGKEMLGINKNGPSIADRFGSFIDGRSEMINPKP